MSVPAGRRKESPLEVQHHLYTLRDDVTDLMIRKFGFSERKYRDKMSKYANSIMECEKKEIVVAEYEAKIKAFNEWFILQETEVCSEMLRNIQTNFTMGNSIYPSQSPAKIVEFIVRRHYMDAAIGSCYALKLEIQYILHTLPVDVNKFERFAKSIDKLINLLKGVKQADNRFIKNRDTDSIDLNMIDILSKISAMSSKLLDNNLKKLLSSDEL